MAAKSGGGSSVPSLPPPCPKSPPEYPDLYGKRREAAKVQMLEREISFLEGYGFRDCKLRSFNTYKPEESKVTSLLEVALVLECPALTYHGSAVAVILGALATLNARGAVTVVFLTAIHATAAPVTAAHALANHVNANPATVTHASALHATAAHLTAVHVNALHVIAVHVNALHVIAVHAVHVNVLHATAVHVNALHATALHVTALHVLAAARFQNGGAALVLNQIAVRKSHAAETVVAFFRFLRARIAVVADGNADALVLNVQRFAVVQKPLVIHAAYYSNIYILLYILMQFRF
ncbi:hypothetical protein COLO4_18088 [Corchorus olitorius]|uniref:Uncharacterized protein n=1 Tax=Corchorus olitorius TaxID=93759 RepID=A0A1R3JAD1_9ROSI|nr:hypothetical protein COLO4_18088 [Corchorus olitorius]